MFLTIVTDRNTPVGSHTIEARAASAGYPGQTTTATLTVTSIAAPPDFTLEINGPNRPAQPGQSLNIALWVTSLNGFGGLVNVTATPPPGVGIDAQGSAVYVPPGLVGGGSVTIQVGANTPPGVHVIQVTASSPGIADKAAQITLTVEGPVKTPKVQVSISSQDQAVAYGETAHYDIAVTSQDDNEYLVSCGLRLLMPGSVAKRQPSAMRE